MSDKDEEIEFDVESAADEIGESLFGPTEEAEDIEFEVEAPSSKVETPTTEAPSNGPTDTPTDVPADDPVDPVGTEGFDVASAPKTWRKEAAAAWATVPDVVKHEIAKREADMFKGIEQYRTNADIGAGFAQLVNPYLPMLNQQGINPYQHVNELLGFHYTLATGTPEQKASLLQQIAQQFNIPLDGLAPADEESYIDPQIASLQQQIQQLQSVHQQAQQQTIQQRRAELESEIQAFSADPANPYFDELSPTMVQLIQGGLAKNLREAYDMAIWQVPGVREKELSRQAAEKQKKAAEHAQQARKTVSANVRTTPKSVSGTAPLGSMNDTIEQAFAEIKARE